MPRVRLEFYIDIPDSQYDDIDKIMEPLIMDIGEKINQYRDKDKYRIALVQVVDWKELQYGYYV